MTNNSNNFSISDNAAKRISFLAKKENGDNIRFRIEVDGGGCSGFQYKFSFDGTQNDDDIIIKHTDAEVIIDEMSIGFVNGGEIDFIDELGGSFFSVKNPNVTASCGCGNSFAV